MNITNDNTMIFTKEDEYGKVHYRAGLSKKNQNDGYDKAYIDVKMPKDAHLDNKTKINITKGFLSFYNYTDKDNKTHTIWYIVVQEFDKIEEKKQEQEVYKVETYTQEDLELPF